MTNDNDNILRITTVIDSDTDFIPLVTQEDETRMNKEKLPDVLPILPLRNNVLFPGVVIPITVGRDKSIKLVHDAYKGDKIIGVVSQVDSEIEDPEYNDLNTVGCVGSIIRLFKMPDGSSTLIIQGKRKFRLTEEIQSEPYIRAKVSTFFDMEKKNIGMQDKALLGSLKDLSLSIIQKSPNMPSEASFAIKNIDSSSFLVNFIASNMNASIEEKQTLLEMDDVMERAKKLLSILIRELQMLELKNDIQSKVKVDIDKQQREYFLHQQIKQIQDELGENPVQQDVEELRTKAEKKKWKEAVSKSFHKEVVRLERMNPMSPEYGVQLNYLQLLLDLPWELYSKDKFDLARAKRILDRDHFGLEKVKERIIEYLAVLKLKGDMRSPILCLYGPPGVGKTSLGKSIAEAIGRKYVRMSLGGIHDEAEIRGHRKTYIGAMPGRIIQNLKKAETSNPVFVLDEIDKIGRSNHGDPSSALLEVLDPEQNNTFQDNYVEMDYDLSRVMFIATANNMGDIQAPLRDRMEIIEITGYTVEEKIQIAKNHLIPKQLKENGLKPKDISFSAKLLETIVENYTNESGVRRLEQCIAKIIRFRAKQVAMGEPYEKTVKVPELKTIMGPSHSREKYAGNEVAGVVTGLAWTPVGGEILFIESIATKGQGKLTLTGNLGDVMKESATIALEFLKAHASKWAINPDLFNHINIHVHVPEGATPKDGPSAGIAMLTALASLVTQRKVKRHLAMTGELTLRGRVLPVGGIKEKILAAKRAGIKEIVLCEANKADLEDIKPLYLEGLSFHFVNTMMEVITLALTDEKVKNPINLEAFMGKAVNF